MATANLERLRRNLRMTQTQYAELMNQADASVRETCEDPEKLENRSKEPYKTITISRMENKADLLSGMDWLTYKNALGLTDEQLVELIRASYGLTKPEKKVRPLEMEMKGNVQDVRDEFRKELEDLAKETGSESLEQYVKRYTSANLSKLKIAFVGASNAGKTTIIASLLGIDADGRWLPTSWQRETNAVCLIRHIDDRPKGNSNRVLAFGEYKDIESGKTPLETGGYELLEKYTSHSKTPETKAGALLIYADAPVLKNCDLIDMPGYRSTTPNDVPERTEEEKAYDKRAIELLQKINWWDADICVDAVFFVSMMENEDFCRTEEDLEMLLGLMRQLSTGKKYTYPPDFYIVASHARSAKDAEEVQQTVSHRIWEMLEHPQPEFDTEENFAEIFSTFDSQEESLTQKFYDDVKSYLWREAVQRKEYCKEELEEEVQAGCTRLETVLRQKEDRTKSGRKESPERMEERALENIEKIYDSVINEDHIVEVINKRKLKKNKEDAAALNSYLRAELNNKVMNEINAVKAYYAPERDFSDGRKEYADTKARKKKNAFAQTVNMTNIAGTIAGASASSAMLLAGIGAALFPLGLLPVMVLAGTTTGFAAGLSTMGGTWKRRLAEDIKKVYEEKEVKSKLKKSTKNKLEKFRREYEKEQENIEKAEISIEEAQKELAAGRKFLAELPAKF